MLRSNEQDNLTMRAWERFFSKTEREIYRAGGYGKRAAFGAHPALLLVDITYAFTGSRPMPIKTAVKEFPSSCGVQAWKALPFVKQLLEQSRAAGIPVIYTTGDDNFTDVGVYTTKAVRDFKGSDPHGIVAKIAPRKDELVIRKAMASAFFGTPLVTYLRHRGIDSIILAGTSTSGCVRATAVDGHSFGFSIFPVEECCFDRSRTSHSVNLFEINSRYGTVITLKEALRWLRKFRGAER